MLSRHFRAHNLNVPEMRLLFSLRCADPGIFVTGGEGEARLPKNNHNNIIFNRQLILQFYRGGGPVFFRGGGSNFFQRWGGVQMLISIKTHNL